MWLVMLGLVLIVLKFVEGTPVFAWPWWAVLSPLALALVWWAFADASGMTSRRAMKRNEKRKRERRIKGMEALGMTPGARSAAIAQNKQVRNTSAMMNLSENQRDLPTQKAKRWWGGKRKTAQAEHSALSE